MGTAESSLERKSLVTHTEWIELAGVWLRCVPDAAGTLVAAVGLLVLIGWIFGIDTFKSVLPGLATMKSNTALCFLLSGLALALRNQRALHLACSGIVCAVAGLTLAEYIGGSDLGLDQLLFRDTVDPHTVYPGRMVQATALGFLLSGVSLLLQGARSRGCRLAQQTLAVCAGVIGVIAVLGYAYNAQQLYRFAGYSSMALHTAASFAVLALGLVFARQDGLARVLTLPGPAALMARRLLPVVLLAPALIGWLVGRGLKHGIFGQGIDLAVMALAMMFSLAALVWWTAIALNRSDAARRETEAQLRNQAEVMDHAHDALIVRDKDGAILYWNRGAEVLYGWPASEALGRKTHTLLQTDPDVLRRFEAALEQSGYWVGELHHTTADGRRVTVESRKTATRTADGRFLILESNHDITERMLAEEALRESEIKYRNLFENMTEEVHFWQLVRDRNGEIENWRLVDANPPTLKTWGRTLAEIKGKTTDEIFGQGASVHYMPVVRKVMDEGVPYSFEDYFPNLDRHFRFTSVPLGEYFITTGADITLIKKAEEALKKAHAELEFQLEERTKDLKEKEVLLNEIHHRVKNNMQVISSLVSLQADGTKDETVREVLKDVTYRVRSMALVHEKLYRSRDLARIDFADYTGSLLQNLWRAHGAVAETVRLTLDLAPVMLPVDTAVPCGLILNELAGNAIKHAFQGLSGGEVSVSLHSDEENRVRLRVADNGIGLPEGLDWRNAQSLGLRLVQMLSAQIDASVEVSRSEVTMFEVSFRLKG